MNEYLSRPLVQIIILNWNGKDDTIECLRSLSKINYRNKIITVVDNASTDGSFEAIKGEFPTLNFIQNDGNLRYAGGNNAAIKNELKGEASLFLIMNNDTIVKDNFLDFLVKTAESDQHIGIVVPKIYYYDDMGKIWYAGGFVNFFTGNIYHRGLRKTDTVGFDEGGEVDYATGCCMLVKRAVFEEIGLFDEAYLYTEDVDFCFRARKAGYKVVFEPQSFIWHKITSAYSISFKIYSRIKSNFRFFRFYAKWYHWLTIPVMVFLRAIQFVIGRLIMFSVRRIKAI
ncbi:MAG: glycosyltransferase family 2 protein [Candidatus Marinimicrobia bacterium]|nr:glycosyltransferase family 2 protein [Candidatus Neomarinimicrobiota bacterium]